MNEGGYLLKFVGDLWSYPRRSHALVWCGNLIQEGLRRTRGFVEELITYPYHLGFKRLDRQDERRAREMRQTLGVRRCLVSWERQQNGLWIARLSGPRIVVTIERTARSRGRAIQRAEAAMNRILTNRPINNSTTMPDTIDPS